MHTSIGKIFFYLLSTAYNLSIRSILREEQNALPFHVRLLERSLSTPAIIAVYHPVEGNPMRKAEKALSLPFELNISYEALARELHGSINRMFIGLAVMLLIQFLFFAEDPSQQKIIVSAGMGAGLAFYSLGIFALHRLHKRFPLKLKLDANNLTLGYKRNLDWIFLRFPKHRLQDRVMPLSEIQTVKAGGEAYSFWLHQVKWTPSWQLLSQSGEKISIWLEKPLDLDKRIQEARENKAEALQKQKESPESS
jgi:hypothetical protein